ncbi:RNA polymerase-binding transcription factor DksA [Ralstonia thomasii]|jgi:DnaK suppressor protein|uniref:RNA polymerase-binding transcription factor DksA n=4 Tax=Pseudomonadota TaxID=1224 RepID=A0AAD2BYV3_9RALS|nr:MULTISPECIES: TraR/DksA family transcriptional regulator [Ralstonia]CAJ0806759.1 RNA polymerase-binding transcription factor DksA [Ralstonia sp. LMG 18095]
MRAEHEARFTAQAALTKRLGQVESALVRLRRGEYGICELTGEEIPIERLRANPLATRTIEAQERAERRSRLFAV